MAQVISLEWAKVRKGQLAELAIGRKPTPMVLPKLTRKQAEASRRQQAVALRAKGC